MAAGLGNSWGIRTEGDPNRGVSREALPQSLASKFHYQENKTAAEIAAMPAEEWEPHSRNGLVEQGRVVDMLRALENYQPADGIKK